MIFVLHPWSPVSGKKVGGVESFVKELLEHNPAKGSTVFLNSEFEGEIFDTKSLKLKLSSTSRLPATLLFTIQVCKFLFQRETSRCTIIIQRPEYAPFIKVATRNCRLVLFLHTDQLANMQEQSDSKWRRLRPLYKLFIPFSYKKADKIYTLSPPSLKFVSPYNSNIEVIKQSLDDAFFAESAQGDRFGALWVGRLETPKNPILGAKVLNLFSRYLKVEMIGEGRLFEKCQSVLGPEIEIQKFEKQVELIFKLKKTKYVVMTSVFEGAPKFLLEALALGCIVICNKASDPANLHKAFPSRVLVVESNNPDSYVETLLKLESNPKELAEPIDLQLLEEFRSSKVMAQLWKKILNN